MRPTPEGVGNRNTPRLHRHVVLASMRPTPEGVGNHVRGRAWALRHVASMRPTPEGVGNLFIRSSAWRW